MIEYSDNFHLETWDRIYPIGHPKHHMGGKRVDRIVTKEELKTELSVLIEDAETVSIQIHREEK